MAVTSVITMIENYGDSRPHNVNVVGVYTVASGAWATRKDVCSSVYVSKKTNHASQCDRDGV